MKQNNLCAIIFAYAEKCYNFVIRVQFNSVAQSCDSLWPHGLQHARPPCPSPTPRASSNSCPSSWWCHPTISSSVIPFSSCPQSFPASGSSQVIQLFTLDSQRIGVSASTSVLPMNPRTDFLQDWLVWSPYSPKDSRVFSNITVQNHQIFSAQPSL